MNIIQMNIHYTCLYNVEAFWFFNNSITSTEYWQIYMKYCTSYFSYNLLKIFLVLSWTKFVWVFYFISWYYQYIQYIFYAIIYPFISTHYIQLDFFYIIFLDFLKIKTTYRLISLPVFEGISFIFMNLTNSKFNWINSSIFYVLKQ